MPKLSCLNRLNPLAAQAGQSKPFSCPRPGVQQAAHRKFTHDSKYAPLPWDPLHCG